MSSWVFRISGFAASSSAVVRRFTNGQISTEPIDFLWGHGVVDDALTSSGRRRTIAVTTPHFAAVPFLLKGARLVSTVPERPVRIFAERFGLETCPVPLELPDSDVSMIRHASYDHDPAHRWLRETISGLAAGL